MARRMGISAFVVGLTIVAIGTSAPELFVNIIAAIQSASDLSIGNILGSNLVNIFLGLGIAAIITPLSLKRGTVWKEIPFSLLAIVVVLIFGSDMLLDGALTNNIGRAEGLALISFFIIFIVYTFGLNKMTDERPEEKIIIYSKTRSFLYILGGIVALAIGGHFAVVGGIGIALTLGVSENLIGLTIVAIGTSLPEIVTAVIAARKRHIDMIVGGMVGSNIFNVFLILGVTATILPLPFASASITDAIAVMVATLALFIFMFIGRRHTLDRTQGILFVLAYFAYIIFAIWRG